MKWIDGKEIDIKQLSGRELCEKFGRELWNTNRSQWTECADFIQTAAFLIDFDTELTMEGIFTFLENSIGHYAPNIIDAFRAIGDEKDAKILAEICRLVPPDIIRGEFLDGDHNEYDISCFDDDHELSEEIEEKIGQLEKQLYLNTGSDIWEPLIAYLDREIETCRA